MVVKLPTVPADGFVKKFTAVAGILNLAMLVLTSDCFCEKELACTASLEGDIIRSKHFCWMPQATDWNHILLVPLSPFLTDGDMSTMGKYGRFYSLSRQKQLLKLGYKVSEVFVIFL